MNDTLKLPFYTKFAFTLLSLSALFTILYFGQDIISPILLALLFAILLRPVSHFLKFRLRFPHVIAVIFTVSIFVFVVAGILYFISWQISDIANDWGQIKNNLSIHLNTLQEMVHDNFNLTKREQEKLIDSATEDTMNTGKSMVGDTLLSFTDMIFTLTLVPIYTFLFLLYRTHFMKFLCKLFKAEHHKTLQEILCHIKISIQSYIIGLIIEMIVVTALTTAGLMFIGVKYAIILGIITGLLNLIPYIGILIAGLLSVVATLTGSPDISMIIGVIVIVVVVQLIDNNLLIPLIVSSKVQINAFVAIIGVITGGIIMGISGMFLAIPMLAIVKVIFDRIEDLKPWGYLMGDDLPKTYTWRNIKLPHYDSESTDDTAQTNFPIFTENTTDTTNTL